MCCIFTCCGWIIDLVQRLWTFAMSCCISSAVCCVLVTSSMSGIALGYNYSLAEYIDLKETNVSVYLKRGVFDDEIADDMDWRRSGHMPVQGHLRDSNLMTGAPENEEMPIRSGRRMDDSLMMSDDQHKFEGSLMKLTVNPPSYKSSSEPVTSDLLMGKIQEQYPKDSIDQLKAIHGLLNSRRANTQRKTKMSGGHWTLFNAWSQKTRCGIYATSECPSDNSRGYRCETTVDIASAPDVNGRRMGGIAPGGVPMFDGPYSNDVPYNIKDARFAVPDSGIGNKENWMLAHDKIPESYRRTMGIDYYDNNPIKAFTRPTPIIFTSEMKRPTRPTPLPNPPATPKILKEILQEGGDSDAAKHITDDELQMFKTQMLNDKKDYERLRNEQIRKYGDKTFQSEDDYAEQANKGVPVRKKRNLYLQLKPKKPTFSIKWINDFDILHISNSIKEYSTNTVLGDINKRKSIDLATTVVENGDTYSTDNINTDHKV